MPSDVEQAPADAVGARRLHPASWLFLVIDQLKAFLVPLVLLLVTGRGDTAPFIGLLGVGGVALAAIARYLSFSYHLGPNGIAITSGVLERTRRDIPYERIHDVTVHQSLLHRLFGVAEVRLESAGGKAAEAEMRVLSLADAHGLEAIVRGHALTVRRGSLVDDAPSPAQAPATTLLALGAGDIVRLGLINNRGWILIAAAVGGLWQAVPDNLFREIVESVGIRLASDDLDVPWWLHAPGLAAAVGVVVVCVALVVVRAFSVLLAFLQFHGFTLVETGHRLRIERGLLTRVRHHLPVARIQAWRVEETLLHRWCGRQSLDVDNAASPGEGAASVTSSLAPIAEPTRMTWLIERLLPGLAWPPADWRPLHPLAWRRLLVRPLAILVGLSGLLTWRFGVLGLLGVSALPLVVLWARRATAAAGYTELGGRVIAVRRGWLNRSWRFAEVSKLQTLRVSQTPFDRRYDMATLWLDTAGATTRGEPFRIPFLPMTEARALYARLAAGLDRVP